MPDNLRKYSGWRGVTDPSGQLLCISYEPIEGWLSIRFKSRTEPYIYAGVPEAVYRELIRSPFAGATFRRKVKDKYPCPFEEVKPPYVATEDGDRKKRQAQEQRRLEEATMVKATETNLFGEIDGNLRKKIARNSRSS